MPIVPTPAAARYSKSGEPSPPAPTSSTRAAFSFAWPMPPTSCSRMCREERRISSSLKSRSMALEYGDEAPAHRGPMPQMIEDHALVLFSGGQDSTTCLAWALARYPHVETIGFAYGQRHAVELDCRAPIRSALAANWPGRLGA